MKTYDRPELDLYQAEDSNFQSKFKENPGIIIGFLGFVGIIGYRVLRYKRRPKGERLGFYIIKTRLYSQGFLTLAIGAFVSYQSACILYDRHKEKQKAITDGETKSTEV